MAVPRDSGGGRKPGAKPKVKVPKREVSIQAVKPQRKVKSKKGSFPAPKPEVTHPVTKAQRKAIDNRKFFAGGERIEQLKKAGKLKAQYEGGDPLSGLNSVFHIAAAGAGRGLEKVRAPKIVRTGAKEIIDSPAQAVPGTVEAIHHPRAVVKQIETTFKHPVKSFKESPVTTLLVLGGGRAAIGRGAGAALRLAPKGSKIERIAATERKDLSTVAGPKQQRYSKDVMAKGVQKAGEKSRRVQEVRAKRFALRATDRGIGTNEGMRRIERDRGREPVARAKSRGHGITTLVNEGAIKNAKTVERDLRQELERLTKQRERLKRRKQPHDLKTNADSIKAVKKALADKKFLASPQATIDAARVYARTLKGYNPERVHYGDLTPEEAKLRPLQPHAIREMGLKYHEGGQQIFDRAASLKSIQRQARKTGTKIRTRLPAEDVTRPGFLGPGNKPVSAQAILADFKAKGGDPRNLAYVPEKSKFKGPGNHYLSTSRRPFPESKTFKGKNTLGGLYERDYNVLIDTVARAAGKVSAHRGQDLLVSQFGVSKPGGKFFNWDEAQKEILNQQAATRHEYVPLQVIRGQRGEAAARIKEGLNPSELPQMFREAEPGDGNLVLFPKVVADRIRQHENIGTRVPLVKAFQSVNQRFRHAVLPTSPRWFVGNITEMLLRTAIEDPTFFKSVSTGRKIEETVKALGGQKAVDRLRSAAGAGHIGAQSKFDIYRAPEHTVTKALHNFRTKHGPKEVADLWELYKRSVFGANTRAENMIYYAGLGKEASREVHSITGQWHKTLALGGKAYEDVARGLLDTPNIERYARAIDDMRGRYSNLSPMGRSLTLTMTPFAPWYVNALHFVFWTLPAKHPIKTGLLGATVESQRKKLEGLGISHFASNGVAPMPAFLLGRVPTKGGLMPGAQYTPFGATTDVGGNLADLVLPQGSFLKNLNGQNFAGNTLKDAQGRDIPAGDPRTVAVALNTLVESFVPFARHARQVREKGGSPTDTSTFFSPQTKKSNPGTTTAKGAERAFNPFFVAGTKKTAVRAASADPLFHDAGKSTSDPLFR